MAAIRRLLRAIVVIAAVILPFAAGAVAVLTLTQAGRDNLAGLISQLASADGRTVRVTGLDGIWSGHLRVAQLVVEDGKGPWIVVRDAALDWSPGALFSQRLEASRLSAAKVEIARPPEPAAQPAEPSGPFRLPVDIAIEAIDLPDIALGQAIAGGRVASIAANGKAVVLADPMTMTGDLAVSRKDGTPGRLDGTVAFVPADNRLDLDVKASEPSGGILAGLLGLPAGSAVDIVLSGSGPAADWKGEGRALVNGSALASLTATHAFTDQGSRVTAKGEGDFSRFLPERFRGVLTGSTRFDLAGTYTQAGGVLVETAQIAGDALDASASGQIDPAGATDFVLQLNARNGGLPLSFGTEESPIDVTVESASIRAFGDGQAPGLDIAAQFPKVATKTVSLNGLNLTLQSDSFDLRQRTGPVVGSARAAALVIDNDTIAPLVAGEIRAGLKGTLATDALTVSEGTLASDALDGRFEGRVSLADGTITLGLAADVLTSALPAAARPVLGQKLKVTTSLERDSHGNTSANSLVLESGGLNGTGVIQLNDDGLNVDVKGRLEDVAPLAAQASGALDFAATAKGSLAAPDVAVSLTSDRLTVADREIRNLDLAASGRFDPASPAADVALKGTVAGDALDGRAVLSTAGGRREVRDLTLSLGPNHIQGSLLLDDAFVPTGQIEFDLPALGPLAALALEKAEGSASGTVTFSKTAEGPQVAVAARVPKVTRQDLVVSDAAIDAVVATYMSAPAVSGTVKAAGLRAGGADVKAIDVKLSREGEWTRFSGGATVNAIPARAGGRVRVADGTTTIALDTAEGAFRGVRATLARPSTVAIANGVTRLDGLALSLGGGSAAVSGTAGSDLALDVVLTRLPLALANAFAPGLDGAGSLSGTVRVSGSAAAPAVRFDIDAAGVQTSQTRGAGFGAMAIKADGSFVGNRLEFRAAIGDGSGLTLNGGGSVALGAPPRLDLSFDGAVPFSFLTRRLAEQGLSLSGTASVAITVTGLAAAPVIGGAVRASGARLIDAGTGIAINDITADVGIASGRATVNRLTGTLSSGGALTVSGSVGIDADQGFPADLSIRLADGRYTDGQVVTTTLSGALAIKGPLATSPALTGAIDLGRTVITVPERLPGSLAGLDVKHKGAPAAVVRQDQSLKPQQASGAGGGSGMTLDLTINAPQQIFIQGRGLDAELGGSLRLVGPVSSPQATGQFTMRRGRLTVLGKRLTFTSGTLGFSGSLVPYLDLTAESTATDATVTVTVTGPANNPKFAFASIPVLPEDEVLARLIFGRSMSNLSPVQIAQLAEAAAQFAGIGGNTSLLDSLRNKLGVDDLDVRTNEQGDTAVSVGKYLNDRTYITIEKGDKAGSGKAAIDLDVGRGLKLRGEAHEDGQAKGGIFYEREY